MIEPQFPIEGVTYHGSDDAVRYLQGGAWYGTTAGDALRKTASRVPDKCAIVSEGLRLSFAEFDSGSERLGAALLNLGLRPGDRALFQMGSVTETAIALLACAKAGIVPVCTLPQHRAIEIKGLAERSEAKAYFVQGDYGSFDLVQFAAEMAAICEIPHLIVARARKSSTAKFLAFEQLIQAISLDRAREVLAGVPVSLADVLMFQLSGGTTNIPKIIPRFHGEFLGVSRAKTVRSVMDEDLVMLYMLPLIHTAGLISVLYPTILLGGTYVMMQRMDAKTFFSLVERERVTHSISIGPSANQMLEYDGIRDHDLSSLRLLTNFDGSEAMERHVGVTCMNVYGIGEGLLLSPHPTSPKGIRYDTVGWPLGVMDEVRLLEPGTERDVAPGELGEVCFRGPTMLRGYFRMPELNQTIHTSDGFFRTGDIMVKQTMGDRPCYSFRGRMRDNISRGGEKFGAEEVETVVGRHPNVLDVKVVAMPDRMYGEKACAYLIMVPGSAPLTVESLGEFLLKEGLAKFKLPERVEMIDTFPVTKVGKVDKQVLRTMIAEKLAREQGTGPAASAQN
jgi:non-ribosomal peptide synthetase component E (peptide arylation enzyme)